MALLNFFFYSSQEKFRKVFRALPSYFIHISSQIFFIASRILLGVNAVSSNSFFFRTSIGQPLFFQELRKSFLPKLSFLVREWPKAFWMIFPRYSYLPDVWICARRSTPLSTSLFRPYRKDASFMSIFKSRQVKTLPFGIAKAAFSNDDLSFARIVICHNIYI